MKRYMLSFCLVIAFALYVALSNQGSANITPAAGGPAAANTNAPAGPTGKTGGNAAIAGGSHEGGEDGGGEEGSGASAPAPAASPAPAPATTTASQPAATAGAFKDGNYTGPVADAFYGPMQVEAIISGGKLTGVKILQYPNTHSYSVEVNSYALPQLAQEAVQTQSANVNIVSGATQSSYAFQQSLAAALTQAKP